MKKLPIIMDVDTGIDDAIALYLVAGSEELDLRGITVASGNQTIDKTLRNTLIIAEMLKLDVPVAKGSIKPLLCEVVVAEEAHGESGLGFEVDENINYPLSEMSAVELMAEIIEKSDEKITLLPTAPLTNIAAFLLAYPHLKDKIESICLMGGGALDCNQSLAAEFNIFVDPEAAQIVFSSGIPIVMCGLDVTHKAYITKEEIERLVDNDSELAGTTEKMMEFYYNSYVTRTNIPGAVLHDSVAAAYLIDKTMFTGFDAYVEVDLTGKYTRGATIVDGANMLGKKPNAFVVTDLDRDALIKLTIDRFQKITE